MTQHSTDEAIDETIVQQIKEMGYSENVAKKATYFTKSASAEVSLDPVMIEVFYLANLFWRFWNHPIQMKAVEIKLQE